MKKRSLLILTLLFALGLPVAAAEQDAASKALVDKIVQAYGGAAVIEGIQSVTAQGRITALMRGAHGTYKRWFVRSGMLRVETHYPSSSETRVLNGDRAWTSNSGGPLRAVTGPPRQAMIYQHKQLDLPYGLLKGSYNLRHIGAASVHEQMTDVMDVWDEDGSTLRVNVDAVSHYIVKITGFFPSAGKAASLSVEFSDFRPVAGLPMPFVIHNFASTMPISETVISGYTANPEAEPSLFAPPLDGLDSASLPDQTLPSYF